MSVIWETIVRVARSVHPDRVIAAADRLVELPVDCRQLPDDLFGSAQANDHLSALAASWQASSLSAPELAAALRGAVLCSEATRSEQSLDLVWTGPSTPFVTPRRTEQALVELIAESEKSLFVVSFVAYQVKTVYAEIAKASARGVEVSILLEPSREHGGMPEHDSTNLMREKLSSARFYYWANPEGAVHAKCAVADEHQAFITSANLTAAAMERNMELGILVKGGDLPLLLHRHLEALSLTNVIEEI